MPALSRPSPAKINLTLRVVGVRADGFHEIESLVARIALYDTVTVQTRADDRFTLECSDPAVPRDETNLALRAARRLAQAAGVQVPGVHVALEKRIPAGAGLGGGSSNAATALMLLNRLWATHLSPAALERLGAELGSDVPLFFHAPLCVIRGRGDCVADLPLRLRGWVVLILPHIPSATRDVYAASDRLAARPQRPELADIWPQAGSVEALMPHLFNDLEPAAFSVSRALAEIAGELDALSGGLVRMTGSGCGFFRLFDRVETAEEFARLVRERTRVRVEVVRLGSE